MDLKFVRSVLCLGIIGHCLAHPYQNVQHQNGELHESEQPNPLDDLSGYSEEIEEVMQMLSQLPLSNNTEEMYSALANIGNIPATPELQLPYQFENGTTDFLISDLLDGSESLDDILSELNETTETISQLENMDPEELLKDLAPNLFPYNSTDIEELEEDMKEAIDKMNISIDGFVENIFQETIQEIVDDVLSEAFPYELVEESPENEPQESKPDEETFHSVVICQDCTTALTCPAGHIIMVMMANYGPIDSSRDAEDNQTSIKDCQSVDSEGIVREVCDYRQECSLTADIATFGNFCGDNQKYLLVEYACLFDDIKA